MKNYPTYAEFFAAAQRLKTCTLWTDEDRLLLIAILANVSLQDMYKGKQYGEMGSPNMTSILHAIVESAEDITKSDVSRIIDRLKKP